MCLCYNLKRKKWKTTKVERKNGGQGLSKEFVAPASIVRNGTRTKQEFKSN
jgi:hypothetical protein